MRFFFLSFCYLAICFSRPSERRKAPPSQVSEDPPVGLSHHPAPHRFRVVREILFSSGKRWLGPVLILNVYFLFLFGDGLVYN